jgi:2-polyprenyl-6-methoxyphenol hydroxylase-like FAD-dependent oxidoreductase/predicted DsbA family dithiol-disulfide isomerase
MKVVVIGGGIAGLSLGIFLQKNQIEVVVNERAAGTPGGGHAFLMHTDGLSVLKELVAGTGFKLPGKLVEKFSLKRPDGEEVQRLQLDAWQCIKRSDLTHFLYGLFEGEVKNGREFSHFLYENGKIIAAVFSNGEVEYGDIFVGADGGFSKVRQAVLGEVEFHPGKVKEIVGIAYNEKIAETYAGTFSKFQKNTDGLAFGMIPTSDIELVWFIQYDPSISELEDHSVEGLRLFCKKLLKKFPPIVQQVLDSNDFNKSYLWNTKDFDLLPAFHKDNVVVIGDAAHLALPFTSAGTTNAMVDAKTLAHCLSAASSYTEAFQEFYNLRAEEVLKHVHLGRALRNVFLRPQDQNDDDIPIPLIAGKTKEKDKVMDKPIELLYFTDPICSTCWIMQPLIRKLKLEYGIYLDIKYYMGGMLPSWELYTKGKIQNPGDAAEHWEEACACHDMPMDGDVWIEDPLQSSFPPSIAFKAAQMQDPDKALAFLRRIQEMVFLEKKNIIKWEHLEKAAFENGLDSARLLRDYQGAGKQLFEQDLELAKKMGVTGFPTLFFSDGSGQQVTLKGLQTYEMLEEIIHQMLPLAEKQVIDTDPKNLFCHFPTMTEKEFAVLSNLPKERAAIMLKELYDTGNISQFTSKNGIIYISKFDCIHCL